MRKLKLDELNRLSIDEYKASEKVDLVIVIDNIRSALNIGSIFRTADALACQKIMICGISATPPHKEIHKSAIGATDTVSWEYYEKVDSALHQLKSEGYQIIAIEQTDHSIDMLDMNFQDKVAIILGNEVKGVSDEALRHVDVALELKQYGTKHSFNVSVCAGICMYHIANKMRGLL